MFLNVGKAYRSSKWGLNSFKWAKSGREERTFLSTVCVEKEVEENYRTCTFCLLGLKGEKTFQVNDADAAFKNIFQESGASLNFSTKFSHFFIIICIIFINFCFCRVVHPCCR